MSNGYMDKIRDPELRRLSEEESDRLVSVLIELDLPPQRIIIQKGDTTRELPPPITPDAIAERTDVEKRISKARAFLEGLLSTAPRWLKTADTFVARVTPKQLRIIAANPMFKAIWPNRTLRASAPLRVSKE